MILNEIMKTVALHSSPPHIYNDYIVLTSDKMICRQHEKVKWIKEGINSYFNLRRQFYLFFMRAICEVKIYIFFKNILVNGEQQKRLNLEQCCLLLVKVCFTFAHFTAEASQRLVVSIQLERSRVRICSISWI